MPRILDAPNGEDAAADGTESVPVTGSKSMLISTIAAYIRTLTQTLTGKTINLTDNTLTGTKAQFNTAMSDADFATIAGSETLTNKTLTAPVIADFTAAQHDHGDADDGGTLALVSDTAYDESTWNGVTTIAPSKNAVRDKIESLVLGSSDSFKTISVSGQSDVVADSSTDTLTIAAGSNVTITTNAGADTVTIAATAGAGALVQKVSTQTGALATGTTTVPMDDTIPQNTEGDQYMTLAITPTDAGNDLYITVTVFVSHSVLTNWDIVSLFQDTTANALATMIDLQETGFGARAIVFTHKMAAGTTSSTTFKVRAGGNNAGTMTFNGTNGSRFMGGVMASSIVIEEIVP